MGLIALCISDLTHSKLLPGRSLGSLNAYKIREAYLIYPTEYLAHCFRLLEKNNAYLLEGLKERL